MLGRVGPPASSPHPWPLPIEGRETGEKAAPARAKRNGRHEDRRRARSAPGAAPTTTTNRAMIFRFLLDGSRFPLRLAAGRGVRRAGASAVPRDAARPKARLYPPWPMTPAEHWSKVSGVLGGAIASARRAETFQRRAATSLDAAAYAFDDLIDELKRAMPVPQSAPAEVVVRIAPRPPLPTYGQQALAA